MTDARDDFRIFEGHEHMFFGLVDPFAMVREEVEAALRRQVPHTVVERIAAFDEPKFLTLARKTDDPSKVIVTAFGVCFRAEISVASDGGASGEQLDATLTFLFREIDTPEPGSRVHFDVHDDAESSFAAEVFEKRFLAFRYGE